MCQSNKRTIGEYEFKIWLNLNYIYPAPRVCVRIWAQGSNLARPDKPHQNINKF